MSGDNSTHLFEISLKNRKMCYLTSSSNSINHDGRVYLPFSGLSIESVELNDSAQNKIVLHGVFEDKGIANNCDIGGSIIRIINYNQKQSEEMLRYICTKQISEEFEFTLLCEPESIKYNQSLLPIFSKTCRANFCDKNCKLKIDDLKVVIEITNQTGSSLVCDGIAEYSNGYFSNGKIFIEYNDGEKEEFLLKGHFANKIELISKAIFNLDDIREVKLAPSCDKKIRTCCYSFNNTVNFRGEPDVPEYRIIKD